MGNPDHIHERNALALADNLADLRLGVDVRFTALENEIVTLKQLVQRQSQVLGDALQALMGRGSTVEE